MIFVPPVIGFILVLLVVISQSVFPNLRFITFPINLLGIVFIVLGFSIMFLAILLFKKYGTSKMCGQVPDKFVRSGIYRLSRNPMYLGLLNILFGICFLIGNLLGFITPVLFFFIIHHRFILKEEEILTKAFGKEYLDYERKVRRWI